MNFSMQAGYPTTVVRLDRSNPVFWIWDSGKIKRLKLGLISTSDLLNKREPPLRGLTNLRSIE